MCLDDQTNGGNGCSTTFYVLLVTTTLPFVLPDKVLDIFQLVVDGRCVFVNHGYMGLNTKKEEARCSALYV